MAPGSPEDDATPMWLGDVVVLDLGDEATALAGALLAELGATVIRVEARNGDQLRQPEARFGHLTANAGKVSLAVDFDDPGSWADVIDRLPEVDVVIGPLDPNSPARALIDAIPKSGPPVVDVIFRRGEWSHHVATDLIVGAASGQLVLNGHIDDPPNHPAGELAYKQTALAAAQGALALVLARRRTGGRGRIELSAQEAMAFTTIQSANGNHWHWHATAPSRASKISDGTTLVSGDGKATSFTIHPPAWPRYVEWVHQVLGPQGIEGPEWNDTQKAVENRHLVVEITTRLVAALTQDELLAEGQARGLLVLPVQDLGDVATDTHLHARDFYEDVEEEIIPGSPFRSNRGRSRRGLAPGLDEGGREVLAELAERRRNSTPPTTTRPNLDTGANGEPIDSRQPLAGIRVVDFCWAIAGPLTTRLLADLGAEVIKLESENRIDPIRYIGVQPTESSSWDTNGTFNDCSPNKRAITLNVDTAEGREIARELIATADVVTANYTPDRLDKWGLGADELTKIKPDLIVANMAVMGTWGPRKDWRSYGSGIVAMCGLAAHTGFLGRTPECLGTLHTDFTVPYFGAIQIMAALHHRNLTGGGAHLELAQYETSARLLDAELTSVLNGAPVPERNGNRSATMAPHGVFPAAGDDRWVAVACRDDNDWRALVSHLPELDGLDRWHDIDEVEQRLSEWTNAQTAWESTEILQSLGVPASPVEDLSDLHGPDRAMQGVWKELPLPAGLSAKVLHEPLLWDGERLPLERAPMWFEHTYEIVVDELGVEPDRFADLVERRVLW